MKPRSSLKKKTTLKSENLTFNPQKTKTMKDKTKHKHKQMEFPFASQFPSKNKDKRVIRAYRKQKQRMREADTRDEQINFPFYNE